MLVPKDVQDKAMNAIAEVLTNGGVSGVDCSFEQNGKTKYLRIQVTEYDALPDLSEFEEVHGDDGGILQ